MSEDDGDRKVFHVDVHRARHTSSTAAAAPTSRVKRGGRAWEHDVASTGTATRRMISLLGRVS